MEMSCVESGLQTPEKRFSQRMSERRDAVACGHPCVSREVTSNEDSFIPGVGRLSFCKTPEVIEERVTHNVEGLAFSSTPSIIKNVDNTVPSGKELATSSIEEPTAMAGAKHEGVTSVSLRAESMESNGIFSSKPVACMPRPWEKLSRDDFDAAPSVAEFDRWIRSKKLHRNNNPLFPFASMFV